METDLMDRLADLETVLTAADAAIKRKNWAGADRLSARVRSFILDAAMWNDRDSLEKMRTRLLAFRSAASRHLDAQDPRQAALSTLLRADAGLAEIATTMRPRALPADMSADVRTATEKVLADLEHGRERTTTQIYQATGLAQGTVSRMLVDLRARGLVRSRRVGKCVYTRLTPRGIDAARRHPGGRVAGVSNRISAPPTAGTVDWTSLALPQNLGEQPSTLSELDVSRVPTQDYSELVAVG